MKTVVFATGGTGGHIFPAVELAKTFHKKKYHTVFAGMGLKNSPYSPKNIGDIVDIDSAPFLWKNPISLVKTFWRYIKGYRQAVSLFKKVNPSLVVGFGSYHSFPILLAAYHKKIPYILYESNSVLGKINKLFCSRAICLTHELFDLPMVKPNIQSLKVKTTTFHKQDKSFTKELAREHFNLSKNLFTILIFGGSQGSKSVNELLMRSFSKLKMENIQVIHLTGKHSNRENIAGFYNKLGVKAYVKEFENNMNLAYQASDLLIARSGSTTIFEQLAFKIPALYVPLPWAADNHQLINAKYAQDILGVAQIIEQSKLNDYTLRPWIERTDEGSKQLTSMLNNLVNNGKKSTDRSLSDFLETLLKNKASS